MVNISPHINFYMHPVEHSAACMNTPSDLNIITVSF